MTLPPPAEQQSRDSCGGGARSRRSVKSQLSALRPRRRAGAAECASNPSGRAPQR